MFLEFIALKDSVADPEGRSGGCIYTPTLCSKFLSYLWVCFYYMSDTRILEATRTYCSTQMARQAEGLGAGVAVDLPPGIVLPLWHPCQSFPLLNCFALFCINLDPEASVNPDKQLFDSSLPFIHNF